MKTRNSILFILAMLLIVSCTSQAPVGTVNAATSTPQLPSTLTPTVEPSETTTPTYTPTDTPTLTWTPLPTYPPNERSEIVMNLYENPTCKLPCWWGITPGETNWRDAWQFLARFATNQAPYDTLLFESERLPDYQFFQVDLDVPQVPGQEFYSTLDHLIFFMSKDTTLVEYIDVNTGNVEPYTIPQILATYGQPEQVYIHTQVSQRPENNSVSLYLDYGEHGFISEHFTTVDQGVWKDESFTACFQMYTRLILGPSGKPIGPEIIAAIYPQPQYHPRVPYQPIEDVSNLTTAQFFEAFAGSSEQVCMKLLTANMDK